LAPQFGQLNGDVFAMSEGWRRSQGRQASDRRISFEFMMGLDSLWNKKKNKQGHNNKGPRSLP
jgi:hypothetical protein